MRNGGMLGVPNTDGRGSWSPAERSLGLYSGIAGSLATRNILNGVLNCAWDKTSATPKLLEIYNTSFVKFNIDSDNPLVMAFANGWDDKDRPAQVVKRLAVAPANIDLSSKANCKVQIVAKVINDELVITTIDIFDPAVGYGANIAPDFASGYVDVSPFDYAHGFPSTKDGWQVIGSAENKYSASYPRNAMDSTTVNGVVLLTGAWPSLEITLPFAACLTQIIAKTSSGGTNTSFLARGFNVDTQAWDTLGQITGISTTGTRTITLSAADSQKQLSKISLSQSTSKSTTTYMYGGSNRVQIYESPTAKFFRSLNKVKDRSDVEQLWINLGYATVDANGAIANMTHYTDMRNNYPGGMRVEA